MNLQELLHSEYAKKFEIELANNGNEIAIDIFKPNYINLGLGEFPKIELEDGLVRIEGKNGVVRLFMESGTTHVVIF